MEPAPPSFSFLMAEFQAEINRPPGQADSKRLLALLSQLSDSGDPAAAPAFVQALDSPELAREAAACLVKLGPAAFASLLPLLYGPDVRRAALAALVLAEIGEPVREPLKESFQRAGYEMSMVAGVVLARIDWPLVVEGMAAARLERAYVEKRYRSGRAEAFFRTRLEDVQAVSLQIGAPLVALIAASQLDVENLRLAAQRVLKEAGWDEDTRAPAFLAAKEQAPKAPALLPRQKRARAWGVVWSVLVVVVCFCLPLLIGMLG